MSEQAREGVVVLSRSEARALMTAAAGRDPADAIRDADLIEQLASALSVALYADLDEAGIDPQAWRQANRALRAAGREQVAWPFDYEARWLAKRKEIDSR